jgi:hypothetical protein
VQPTHYENGDSSAVKHRSNYRLSYLIEQDSSTPLCYDRNGKGVVSCEDNSLKFTCSKAYLPFIIRYSQLEAGLSCVAHSLRERRFLCCAALRSERKGSWRVVR